MNYIFAYDGGGTKTHLAVFTLNGFKVYEEIGLGSNHASSDGYLFESVISGLFNNGKKALNISNDAIKFIYLGLSGADTEEDYKKLHKLCNNIFASVPYQFDNDAWIIMRSGLTKPYGAVAISGTGTNAAAMNKTGHKTILRSLGYVLGIYGGGLDIAREALHYAFRADELTYKDTLLKPMILDFFNAQTMDEVVTHFYPKMTINKQTYGKITALVFEASKQNDEVANEILKRIATFIAEQTHGVCKQVGIDKENIPIVTGGRVLEDETTVLFQTFKTKICSFMPQATLIKPKYKPVIGAFLSALDALEIKQTPLIDNNLKESGCEL